MGKKDESAELSKVTGYQYAHPEASPYSPEEVFLCKAIILKTFLDFVVVFRVWKHDFKWMLTHVKKPGEKHTFTQDKHLGVPISSSFYAHVLAV